ncbi:hypothetical protein BD779DRAFT_1680785 [Infundibulicybe gibba]|nr:hypothetical protein BD779DRAFT_1680785 [Infundibulicybe gibba]
MSIIFMGTTVDSAKSLVSVFGSPPKLPHPTFVSAHSLRRPPLLTLPSCLQCLARHLRQWYPSWALRPLYLRPHLHPCTPHSTPSPTCARHWRPAPAKPTGTPRPYTPRITSALGTDTTLKKFTTLAESLAPVSSTPVPHHSPQMRETPLFDIPATTPIKLRRCNALLRLPCQESSPSGGLTHLRADIICFQEMKSSHPALPKAVAVPPSFHTFSFPLKKSGFSGVAKYTCHAAVIPLKAEEGITGTLPLPKLSTSEERVSQQEAYPQRVLLDANTDAPLD